MRETREVAQRLKELRPEILIEGEIGFIGASPSIHSERPVNMSLDSTGRGAGVRIRSWCRFPASTGRLASAAIAHVSELPSRFLVTRRRIYMAVQGPAAVA